MLEVNITVDDPDTFYMPWRTYQRYQRSQRPLAEFICAENNQIVFDYHIPVADKAGFLIILGGPARLALRASADDDDDRRNRDSDEGGITMNRTTVRSAVAIGFLASAALVAQAQQPAPPAMSFFKYCRQPDRDPGDLGGNLPAADQDGCVNAAGRRAAAGTSFNHTWHAYLSQEQRGTTPRLNARDRIGTGPWYNAKGQMIASDVAAGICMATSSATAQQHPARDGARCKGQRDPRQRARHPHRPGPARPGVYRRQRSRHLQQLDPGRQRALPQANPNVPPGPRALRCWVKQRIGPAARTRFMECGAYEARAAASRR